MSLKVGIYCPGMFLCRGGTERFCQRLTEWLLARGHRCVIIKTSNSPHWAPLYPLPAEAEIVSFRAGAHQANGTLLKNLGLDVLCTLTSNASLLTAVHACHGTSIPLLISERNCPTLMENQFWARQERLAAFMAADRIHLLSPAYVASLPEELHAITTVTANPVPIPPTIDVAPETREQRVIAVGRHFERDKQLSLLIRAFAFLKEKFPDWTLHIYGDGPSRPAYEQLVERHGLGDTVFLHGIVAELDAALRTSSIFCMPSAHEGCPNALLEALSYGLPAVGFPDCEGLNEIIIDGKNGLLVHKRSPKELAQALASLMAEPDTRQRMSHAARESSLHYASERILPLWEELLHETASCKGNTKLDFPKDTEEQAVYHTLRHLVSSENAHSLKPRMRHFTSAASTLRKRYLGKGEERNLGNQYPGKAN